jgi:hypothetical protein
MVFRSSVALAQEELMPLESASPSAIPTATPLPIPETPINVTVSPITLQMETPPGGSETQEIKIRNNGTEEEPLKVSFGTFSFNERTQQIDLNQTDNPESLSWMSVDQPIIVVKPSEWASVNVTFAPPPTASLSYYYAVIFSRVDEKTPDDLTTTRVTGAPAVLVLANVQSPLTKRELQLESFSVPKVWIEFLPQTFVMNIRNTGNVHVAPAGNIFIDGPQGKDIAVLPLNPKNSQVLPETMRELSVSWDDGFPKWIPKTEKGQSVLDENGNPEQELQWDFSQVDRFRFGKYTAHLLLVYDNGERDIPIESYVSFWVIPWRVLLVALVILVFFLLGVRSSLVSLYRSLRPKKST